MPNFRINFESHLMKFANGNDVTTCEEWGKRRLEIIDILARNEYGFSHSKLGETSGRIISKEPKCAGGHGVIERLEITFLTEKGEFSFPVRYYHPNDGGSYFTFVFINFFPDDYNMYLPVEEIIDSGCAVATFYYNDVTADNADFTDKMAGMYERKGADDWGKIGMWAFAASRVADYLETRTEVSALGVIGHSRLGKTALWCGAQDERFRVVISNDSGCSGAAYERIKHGDSETIKKITGMFPYWFCEKYLDYADKPFDRDFDQHFLLALIAPRLLCVGSASRDLWADPYSEQLSCIAATPAWKIYGLNGYVGPKKSLKSNKSCDKGEIHYHLRDGMHFLSRNDWNYYINFIKKHIS